MESPCQVLHLKTVAIVGVLLLHLSYALPPTNQEVPTSSPNCPYNPCTPQRLGCQRLFRNELGCLLCKCENATTHSNRPCELHGCTVELLQCNGSRLKKTEDGCTLCACEDQGATTTLRLQLNKSSKLPDNLPIVPASDDVYADVTTVTPARTVVTCPTLDCTAEDLGCGDHGHLVVNPLTGCEECDCAENPSISGPHLQNSRDITAAVDSGAVSIMENPCPDPMEILEGEEMRRGVNKLGNKRKPMYKLSVGKLKKGFEPGRSYKISLKANRRAKKFRAFLFTVKPAAITRTKTIEASDPECGAGILNDFTKKRKKGTTGPVHARPIPRCPTQAIEADGRTNKSVAFAEWTAPNCGCVYISVAVVDETNTVGYLDESFTNNQPITSKINRHLIKTVCAKTSSSKKGAKSNKRHQINRHHHNKSWISTTCCYAGWKEHTGTNKKNKQLQQICEDDGNEFSLRKHFRYRVFKAMCKKAYKACCLMSPKVAERSFGYAGDNSRTGGNNKQQKSGGGNKQSKKGGGKGRQGKHRGSSLSGGKKKRNKKKNGGKNRNNNNGGGSRKRQAKRHRQ